MNLNNLRIATRLSLGFGAVLVLLVLIVAMAWSRLAATRTGLAAMLGYQQQAELAQDWYGKTQLNVSRAIAIAKTSGQPQVQLYFEPLIKQTSAEIGTIQKKLEALIESADGKEVLYQARDGDSPLLAIPVRGGFTLPVEICLAQVLSLAIRAARFGALALTLP